MPDHAVENAYAFLRSHTTGDLRFEENIRPLKFVIAPDDGRLIAPVMVAMLRSFDLTLFVPSYEDGAMEMQVSLEQFDERGDAGAAADRWRIYHGEPPDVRWAFMTIDAARAGEYVVDGEALMRANPLQNSEAQLCKEFNDHPDLLRELCKRHSRMEVERPVMVGIDPSGCDIRALFDVVRVPSIQPMPTPQIARQVLNSMASGD